MTRTPDLKPYQHRVIEEKWRTIWLTKQRYATDSARSERKAYVLDMFPYPSGEGLHVGHPLGYIGSDILARYLRATGHTVLHPMGYDAFGLPAENYAMKTGTPPAVSTAKAIARFREQMQLIGLSYDWQREIVTSDPSYYRWTQWIFLKLYAMGLAYRKTAPVNWCPKDQTVLANEQVKDGKCERCDTAVVQRELPQWFFKITNYAAELLAELDDLDWPEPIKLMQRNWIGRSEGAVIRFPLQATSDKRQAFVEVFTTRPDTLFGATFLVLAPEHPFVAELLKSTHQHAIITNVAAVKKYIEVSSRKKELERKAMHKPKTGVELQGVQAVNPANQEKLPIWIADYVLMGYGTGAIMAVPAHDERDFAFAQANNLPIKTVIIPSLIDQSNPPQPNKEETVRSMVLGILYNPQTDRYLTLRWKNQSWTTFVTGGIEADDETNLDAIRREIIEETGYLNFRLVRSLGEFEAFYFAAHKNVNRRTHAEHFLFELLDETQQPVSQEEESQYELQWLTPAELLATHIQHVEFPLLWQRILQGHNVYTGNGILIHSAGFDGQTSEVAKSQITQSVGGAMQTHYRLRDWLVSRQRYWGAPIPIVICATCGDQPVPIDQLPVRLPTDVDFRPTGESPLAHSVSFHAKVSCPNCGGAARREVDTMDTFVDSSWYFLRYLNPDASDQPFAPGLANAWLPVDWYVGGAEHAVLHLLYARFFTKVLADAGLLAHREPFKRLRNQGLILGEDQRKMSKRWGNVINPDDIVRDYGADALRCFEMFMGPFADSKPWSQAGLVGVRRWLDRIWKLQLKLAGSPTEQAGQQALHQAIAAITRMIAAFEFNTAISELMKLTNCWEKLRIVSRQDWCSFLQLLAPFAPHLANELWEQAHRSEQLDQAAWPKADPALLEQAILTIPIQVNGKVRGTISLPHGTADAEIITRAKSVPGVAKYLAGREMCRTVVIHGRIVNFVVQ